MTGKTERSERWRIDDLQSVVILELFATFAFLAAKRNLVFVFFSSDGAMNRAPTAWLILTSAFLNVKNSFACIGNNTPRRRSSSLFANGPKIFDRLVPIRRIGHFAGAQRIIGLSCLS